MRHVGLEAERSRPIDHFQQLDHALPTVHAAPADFPFGGQARAVLLGDAARLAEGVGDEPLVPLGVLAPGFDRAGRIDADLVAAFQAQLRQPLGDAARLADLVEEPPAVGVIAQGRAAAGAGIHRGHDRAHHEVPRPGQVGQPLDLVLAAVDVEVRMVEEDVEAVEADAVDRGGGGEIEHLLQPEGRFAPVALAHQSRPDGVVQLRIVVRMVHAGFLAISII